MAGDRSKPVKVLVIGNYPPCGWAILPQGKQTVMVGETSRYRSLSCKKGGLLPANATELFVV